ncbi:hypothetical protein [Hymenobacter sp. GOD-10R]|uniref:hypothetical protein n=1 Tax=Hymenobacter sp. GOD-10R TaxID=3093922 RepID=UPI002D769A80|nr:hypothetical protein [Hymenobacter sp. GOD-10R]WRQ30486.1 hypothetical protein SD425_09455 [Hymenobacter sp. GOD-10R]
MFDIDYFRQTHRDYEKLGLAPWAVNEKPPLVIRQAWVSRLVADYHAWHAQIVPHFPDYYLAVWLFEPESGRSQLVAGLEDRKTLYENFFGPEANLPFPTEYQQLPGVTELHWTARAQVEAYWPEDFAELGSWGLNRPHWEAETADGEPFFTVQVGWVWVGQKPV